MQIQREISAKTHVDWNVEKQENYQEEMHDIPHNLKTLKRVNNWNIFCEILKDITKNMLQKNENILEKSLFKENYNFFNKPCRIFHCCFEKKLYR